MAIAIDIDHPWRVLTARKLDRKAQAICNALLQEAIIQIRTTAYLRRSGVHYLIGEVDYVEEIRRLADLCDGLAGPLDGANRRLTYRLSVLSADQAGWVREALSANGYSLPNALMRDS